LFLSLVLFLSNLQYLIACMSKQKERILPLCFFVLAFGIMSRLPPEFLLLVLLFFAWFINKSYYYKVELNES
jgi:4-amino-4-deoxy-L-arabinose transferase-like glycosyltransferase